MLIRTQNGKKIIDAKVIALQDFSATPPFTLYASASTESFHVEIGKYETLSEAMAMLEFIYYDAKNNGGTDLYNFERAKNEDQR